MIITEFEHLRSLNSEAVQRNLQILLWLSLSPSLYHSTGKENRKLVASQLQFWPYFLFRFGSFSFRIFSTETRYDAFRSSSIEDILRSFFRVVRLRHFKQQIAAMITNLSRDCGDEATGHDVGRRISQVLPVNGILLLNIFVRKWQHRRGDSSTEIFCDKYLEKT